MSQHIIVRDYDPLWIEKYRKESSLVKDILAENCVAIYHIGSTSVPGLAAKPIIDIMAVGQESCGSGFSCRKFFRNRL